ncbi:hypothetical protein [Anaerocolumna xylanovorans]|uniref:Uncharacterized protein n=1 Tax=Anaerocolumna xylanovorans DSM 12503 TaxID=1121345 RepID=A0A1M7YHM9_9FIRM|nr:hypothetical protein [Anaerocolumna xylanovorans]SHO52038.1 hypothetical protein SAMN02745217_03476 [Anaerocolumna xylanovorans DSM 12503]
MNHEYDKYWNWTKVGVGAISDIASVAKVAKILKNVDKVPTLAERIWKSAVDAFTPGSDDLGTGIGDAVMGQLPKDKQETIKWLAGLIPIYGTYQAVIDATSDDPIKGVFISKKCKG